MNVQELKTKVKKIISKDTSLSVFFVLYNEEGEYIIRKADLAQGDTTEDFIEIFREYLDNYIINNEELSLCDFSSSDNRENAVYNFDYEVYPKDLSCIHEFEINECIKEDIFSFSDESLSDLRGYLIYLGSMEEGVVLYKKHYPVSLIKRDSFLLYKKDSRFVKFEGDDILRINGSAQIMKLGNEMYVLDANNFERNFGFEEILKQRAEQTIQQIDQKGILEDTEVLQDSLEGITFARKLSKISRNSPVIDLHIPNKQIIKFTKKHPGLKGKLKYNEDSSKIRLDTKASKTAFLKLLNDDYLISELTNQSYDSIAKDRL